MPIDIQNKVAIVTGGATGLGFSFAKELLSNGLRNVTVVDVNEDVGNESVKTLCQEYGSGKAVFVKADVRNDLELEDAFKETLNRFKNIDIVVNNAGISDEPNWSNVIDINLKGVIRGTLLGLDYISKHKSGESGLILNMSSVSALAIFPGFPFYSATKSAVLMISRSFGDMVHYDKTKVDVVCLCPGLTDTALVREGLQKTYTPEHLVILNKEIKTGKYKLQEPSHVSKSFIQIIKKASTGSAWVIANGEEAYELEFPERYGSRKQ